MAFFSNLFKKKDTSEYLSSFSKTNEALGKKIKFKAKNLNPETFLEDLTVTFIEADIGFHTSEKIVKMIEKKSKSLFISKNEEEILDIVSETFKDIYQEKEDKPININTNGPTVYLVIGVNGSGKTTSISKLANKFKNEGKNVLLVAADTFRAGAIEQLSNWSKTLNVPIVKGNEGQDPSSVIVDGLKYANENNIDIVLCDTAGRLQNKTNLMNELEKMNRVMDKYIKGAPHNTFLVLDGNTGQNGLSQAQLFSSIANVNGIILTKMDGTSKGGIIMAIKDETGIPVRYLTFGENIEAIKDFDLDLYLYSIIGEYQNES